MQFSIKTSVFRSIITVFISATSLLVVVFVWRFLYIWLPSTQFSLLSFLLPLLAGSFAIYIVWRSKKAVALVRAREEAIIASQNKFEHVYKSSPVPYVNLDKDGIIVMTNLAAMRLLGLSAKNILGQPFEKFLVEREGASFVVLLNKLKNRVTMGDVEVQIKNEKSDNRWVLLSVFEFGKDGDRLVSLVDITKQKEIEETKTEFIILASHQLRTPIASIRWNTELLESTNIEITEEQSGYYLKINRNIERLVSLVNDFLNASKLELGTFATKSSLVPIKVFVQESLDEFEVFTSHKKLQIQTKFSEGMNLVRIDKRLLHIILTNLISNAVKYTPEQGKISIGCYEEAGTLRIEVKDTGMGVPVSELSSMFTKFYRASNARDLTIEGTGLGLYLVHKSVSMMNGSIKVDSEEGKGSLFTVSIPL